MKVYFQFAEREQARPEVKADSYARAIKILDEVLPYQNVIGLNSCNGICLSALYDNAFDKGLITISPDDYSVRLSSALRECESQEYYAKHFGSIKGQ